LLAFQPLSEVQTRFRRHPMQPAKTQPTPPPRAPSTEVRRKVILDLVRARPEIVLELLSRLTVAIPAHQRLQREQLGPVSAGGADPVVLSLRGGPPALGVIVDAQVEPDTTTRYAWPHQACALRAELRCPVLLCVVTPRRSLARWAARPIRLGGGNLFQPTALGPAAIPAIVDSVSASQLPELAVLSSIAHGRGLDQERAARIAAAALQAAAQLELELCQRYTQIVRSTLGEPARRLLHEMELCSELAAPKQP